MTDLGRIYPTPVEVMILYDFIVLYNQYKDKGPERKKIIENVLEALQGIDPRWTKKRILKWINNNKRKVIFKQSSNSQCSIVPIDLKDTDFPYQIPETDDSDDSDFEINEEEEEEEDYDFDMEEDKEFSQNLHNQELPQNFNVGQHNEMPDDISVHENYQPTFDNYITPQFADNDDDSLQNNFANPQIIPKEIRQQDIIEDVHKYRNHPNAQ